MQTEEQLFRIKGIHLPSNRETVIHVRAKNLFGAVEAAGSLGVFVVRIAKKDVVKRFFGCPGGVCKKKNLVQISEQGLPVVGLTSTNLSA